MSAARRQQLDASNQRKSGRSDAVRELNMLADEVQVKEYKVDMMSSLSATEPKVDRLIRILQPRCQEPSLHQRLRQAAATWVEKGGSLSQPLVERQPGGDEDVPVPEEEEAADKMDLKGSQNLSQVLPMHYVLEPGYILHSKAFMATYNNRAFTLQTWDRFKEWMPRLSKTLGARAWAACIEKSLNADASDDQTVYHLHGYLFWTDGVGIYRRNLNDFKFENVFPRIDKCVVRSGVTPRTAACHGLWYVACMKKGTIAAATNYQPWTHYRPQVGWLQGLHEAKKLSHERYLELSQDFAGHASRKTDVMEVIRDEREHAVRELVAAELASLKANNMFKPLRHFDEVCGNKYQDPPDR